MKSRTFEVLLQYVQEAQRARRKAWPIPVALGGAIAAGSWFGLASRRDDLQSILLALGAFIVLAGVAMLASTFRSPDAHALVSLLRDELNSIRRVQVFNVIRNNAFVSIRIEFYRENGKTLVYALPRQKGEALLSALYAERPDLAQGAPSS
ncbi:MAG: hypothetical protein AB8H86_26880 [Polyangiales bacterium]